MYIAKVAVADQSETGAHRPTALGSRPMSRALVLYILALAAILPLTACSGEPAATPPAGTDPTAETGGCQALAELASLDPREPVPLQPMMAWHQKQNMQQHLVAIQRIVGGLGRGDWEAVSRASELIESSPQMQQMCQHMGAGADGFTELALDFHRRADAIGEAARARDTGSVLLATSHTLEACTGCHSRFRQEVVDSDTWQQRTESAQEPIMHQAVH